MRRRLALLALAMALLAALPPAQGGREEEPEVVSPRDQIDPSGDLLAAWLEAHPEGLKITFKVAGLGEREVHRVYSFALRVEGTTQTPAIGFDREGRLRTDSGANPSGWGGPSRAARVDDALRMPDVVRGSPAYLSAIVPWDLYPGLEPEAEIEPVFAASALYDGQTRRWFAPYDSAESRQATFLLSTRIAQPLLPILVPAWVLPAIVGGSTLLGAGGGMVLALVLRARPAPPAPAAAPASLPRPPPPGRRFRRDPREALRPE